MADAADIESNVLVTIAPDGRSATLAIEPGVDPTMLNEQVLCGLIATRDVVVTAETKRRVVALLESFTEHPDEPAEAVVAEGTAPVHGRDGWFGLDPAVLPSPKRGGDASADDESDDEGQGSEKIDYYAKSAFAVVRGGQRIGVLHPPEPGVDGADVRGRVLAARQGKALKLKTDESVTLQPDGAVLANHGGLVEHDESSVKVLRELLVPKGVDFHTGNIDFPGDVVIRKGVRDCFTVRADGDLTVHDLVEAATLVAGHDATLTGGMAAREKGTLRVGRDLHAKYLDNVECSVARDLTVDRELANSTTEVGRAMDSPRCSVIGGSLVVTQACHVAQTGSEAGVPTEIVLGKIAELEELAKQAMELMPRLEARSAKAQEELDQLKANITKLTPTQAERMTELEFEVGRGISPMQPLIDAMTELRELVHSHSTVELTIERVMYAGTTIWLGVYRAEVQEAIKGPLRITLDARGQPLITDLTNESVTPLTKLARVIKNDRFVDLDALGMDQGDELAEAA